MWGDRAIHQQDKSAINYVVPVILGIGITYGAFMTLSLFLFSAFFPVPGFSPADFIQKQNIIKHKRPTPSERNCPGRFPCRLIHLFREKSCTGCTGKSPFKEFNSFICQFFHFFCIVIFFFLGNVSRGKHTFSWGMSRARANIASESQRVVTIHGFPSM